MITSAQNRGWSGDVAIPDHAASGLPAPSIVRTAKIATIEARVAEPRGVADAQTLAEVRRMIGDSPEASSAALD